MNKTELRQNMDRDKVIKGLDACANHTDCATCGYANSAGLAYDGCMEAVMGDALALLKAQEPITGETSDGYHTFNELYHHRAVLFSVIVANYPDRAWKSKRHHDGTMYDGMFIVGIDTPDGQATYHYDVDPYWDMFKCRVLDNAPEWDGHTPAQAIERISKLKAREPRVMTENDMREAEPGTVIFCEQRDEVRTYLTPMIKYDDGVYENRFLGAEPEAAQLANTRFWTSRPTKEQMETEPWN